jgi:hypothetical protein
MKQIYHHWEKWECYKAGFYNTTPPDGITHEDALKMYCEFLGDLELFEDALGKVIHHWKYSCEQFLTNQSINKIAWLGQASACYEIGLPSKYRAGFKLLSKQKQNKADALAERYYKIWKRKYLSTLNSGSVEDMKTEYQTKFLWF